MKLCLPLLASVLALASCSSVYKTGQTPDDVYYSPARERDEYVRTEKKDDRQYNNEEDYREDRYLRMKTAYRRYSILDNYDYYVGGNYNAYYDYYRYNSFGYYPVLLMTPRYYGAVYNPYYYNPHYYNPYYNNPYYSGVVLGNARPVYTKPRGTNLNTYYPNSEGNNYSRPRTYSNSNTQSSNTDNYRNSGTNAGGFLRNVFGSGNSNSSSSQSSNNSSSSSSSSSSGSSSSGSSAPVRKF